MTAKIGNTEAPGLHDLDLNSIVGSMPKPVPREADPQTIRAEILEKLAYAIGKDPIVANDHDWLDATILALRDRIIDRLDGFNPRDYRAGAKRVYYLSLNSSSGGYARCAGNLELHPRSRRHSTSGASISTWSRPRSGRGIGQWRTGPACRLFHGKHGEPRYPRLWLRHPLRSRLFRQKSSMDGRESCRKNGENGNPSESRAEKRL